MAIVQKDVPRVSSDGFMVEKTYTQIAPYTEAFDSWSTPVRLSIVANSADYQDPWGTYTADVLHEDVAGGANTTHAITNSTRVTGVGDIHTFCVYAQPINRDWLYFLDLSDSPDGCFFNVDTCEVGTITGAAHYGRTQEIGRGWCRACCTFTTDNAATQVAIYIGEADNDYVFVGLDQDSIVIWGADWIENTYGTSHIPNTGTGYPVKLADDVTIDPHPANENKDIIPETICDTCNATELTVQFDAKCWGSNNEDIDESNYLFSVSASTGTASSTRNRFDMYVTSSGRVRMDFRSDSTSTHYMYSASDATDYSEWFTMKVYMDFADLSNMDLWLNGSNAGITRFGNAGTATFDTSDTRITIGQTYFNGIITNCTIRNLRVEPEQF